MRRYKKEIVKHLSALMQEGPIEENKNYIQHGDVTVLIIASLLRNTAVE